MVEDWSMSATAMPPAPPILLPLRRTTLMDEFALRRAQIFSAQIASKSFSKVEHLDGAIGSDEFRQR